MKLYTYHTSSASYRVRIALGLKALEREDVYVDIAAGENRSEVYMRENPNARVPFLVDGSVRIGQALAILEYLEEAYPTPALLPADPAGRAWVRELGLVIIADVQPLQNLSPIAYLRDPLGLEVEAIVDWYRHWVSRGLEVVEAMLVGHPETGVFCHGDTPTLADVVLVPQVVNWIRKGGGNLEAWPTIGRIFEACQALPAFRAADPERQPDAPKA